MNHVVVCFFVTILSTFSIQEFVGEQGGGGGNSNRRYSFSARICQAVFTKQLSKTAQ